MIEPTNVLLGKFEFTNRTADQTAEIFKPIVTLTQYTEKFCSLVLND